MILKLMTFNIQHGRNHNYVGDVIDLFAMAENVKKQNADIVGFNEVRCGKNSNHSSGYSDQASFFAAYLGGDCRFGRAININKDCAYGNAVFSKIPMTNFEVINITDATERIAGYYYESRCILKSEYKINGKKLTVLNAHFGLGPQEQNNAVDTALSLISKIDNPIVLMGDFNMTPEDHNIQRLSAVLNDAHAYLGKDEYTFPSNSPEIRIDYIFTHGLKIKSAETVKNIVSDHYAVTAEVEI